MTEPTTPDVTKKRPRNRRARATQITIASVGVAVLLIAGLYAAVAWPRVPSSGPAADVQAEYLPWMEGEYADPQTAMWTTMNNALRDKDREAFLSYASGDAVAQLGQWWDNTTAIGWDVAAISPVDIGPAEDNTQEVLLGAQFAFAAHPERGSGDADAALSLIQGFQYKITLTPAEEPESSFDRYNEDGSLKEEEPVAESKILSIVPSREPNPWDEGSVHVAQRDHVVLFGMSDEAALVDQHADAAETAAVVALDEIRGMGGNLPQDGFLSAITADPARFARWQYGTGTPWEMDVAGYARPTLRPSMPQTWLDPVIATGFDTSGTLVVAGPASLDELDRVLVHEFAHALHHTAAPGGFTDPPAAVMEGFARYVEWSSGVSEPRYTDPAVKDAIARLGADAFSNEALRTQDANTAYDAAGSYYAFVAEKGASPWDLAISARQGFGGLVAHAEGSDEVSIAAWQAWVAAQ